MTEEINHSYDGGLYAEMVSNRTFHDSDWDIPQWALGQNGESEASMSLDKTHGPSEALTRSLRIDIHQADENNTAGARNDGFWGMALRPNTEYRGSFYAKASAGIAALQISLVSDVSGQTLASTSVPGITEQWARYEFRLKTGNLTPSAANHLAVVTTHPGTLWLDLVSLFPPTYKDRVNGNRIDLMQKLAAMQPRFLRFPGGNYLEGNHRNERYDWKKTIGPLVDRPTHPSPWEYWSSDGLGLLEFLEWCQDLNMQPVLAVYAGYSMAQDHVDAGPLLEPYVQDALDEIQYVTGDVNTPWGAVRAKDGHPQPFPLSYVEVGNEDNFDNSGSYSARYAQFYKAIKQRYPQLQIIATTPVKGIRPDVIDDHYYRSAQEFFADTHHYDSYDRSGPKIFVGEWATREGTPTPDMGAALGDAAWMTGMERNSDVIVMASYAPLLTNVNPGAMQWAPDLIGYDALHSYGSPSYWAQVLFSSHLGTQVLASTLAGAAPARFFSSVTQDTARGTVYLKLVNASSVAVPLHIQLAGGAVTSNHAHVTVLRGTNPADTNSMADPDRITPKTLPLAAAQSFEYTMPAYSIQVLDLPAR
jgi:alpha-N-arabinofuranosidase